MSAADPAGRLLSQTRSASGGSGLLATQGWLYNGLGLPAHHYHARSLGQAPFVVSYDYDAGLPVKEYANGIPVVTGIGYQASGALAGYVTGMNVGHNVTTAIAQDASLLPRPSSISTSGATVPFVSGAYSYDGAGNIMAIGLDQFGYDLRSRLTSASLSGSGNQSFAYDQFGNLLSKTGTPGNTTFCTGSCSNNRLPSNIATYDGRGNMTANLIAPGGAENYTLDGLDRLITHQGPSLTWDYLYDGESERTAKVLRSGAWTYTFRDEGKRVSSEFGGANPSRNNVFLGNLLAVSYASIPGSDRVWTFYSSDHLGTPRLVTDVAATTVESPKNWPFGENVTTPGVFQRIRFASMERDTEASRYHDHARGHEFNLGRFLSPDKLRGNPEEPQGWNRYAYAYNNPLRHVDPNGQDAWDVLAGFANAVGSNFAGGGRQPAYNSDVQTGQTLGDLISIPLGGLEILAGAATFTAGLGADATVVGAPAGVALNAAGVAAVAQGVLGASSGAVHLAEAANQGGLGNPFKDKTAGQADQMMRDKGFETSGPDPKGGKGGYVNPETGRSYHLDPGGEYRKGTEGPHVDVNRPRGSDLPKKKLPLKDPVDN